MEEQLERAFQEFEQRLIQWAQNEDDVRGIVVIGSRARMERPADAWSDMDIILLVGNPQHYIVTSEWIHQLGDVRISFLEGTAIGNDIERRVLFDGGVDVDFVPTPAGLIQAEQLADDLLLRLCQIVTSGIRILVDKDGFSDFIERLPSMMPERSSILVSEADFENLTSDFWYHCVWTAKKLRRGETLTALGGLHYLMNHCVLPMARYHAHAIHGEDFNSWHGYRFFEIWADTRILKDYARSYARYDQADIWRALFATMELFEWLCPETAYKLGFEYPQSMEICTREWVMHCFHDAQGK